MIVSSRFDSVLSFATEHPQTARVLSMELEEDGKELLERVRKFSCLSLEGVACSVCVVVKCMQQTRRGCSGQRRGWLLLSTSAFRSRSKAQRNYLLSRAAFSRNSGWLSQKMLGVYLAPSNSRYFFKIKNKHHRYWTVSII